MISRPTHFLRRTADFIPTALLWRYLCHSLMLGLAMLNELRAAPTLPDTILDIVPYTPWVHEHNYMLWILGYVPLALWLWRCDRGRFVHFLYVGGVISLLRGACIVMTGLGPVHGADINAGMDVATALDAWFGLVNPFSAVAGGSANVYLTKDLFFSGHTATTFLLLLYCWSIPKMRVVALLAHVFVVGTVFLSHLHYTIDVIGAWGITFSVFILAQRVVPMSRFGERKKSAEKQVPAKV